MTALCPKSAYLSLPHTGGVYAVWDKEYLLYIGRSKSLYSRFRNHCFINHYWGSKFSGRDTHVTYVTCEDYRTRLEMERWLIVKHRPPLNLQVYQPNPQHLEKMGIEIVFKKIPRKAAR